MRLAFCLLLFCLGCSPASTKPTQDEKPTEEAKPGAESRIAPLEAGSDWPSFLGPNGDGSSPETGINTNWKAKPLKKLWEAELGVGYAPPSVAQGKLFHFDCNGKMAWLTCRNAVTGELIWRTLYAMDYEDRYGYDSGPRACPVIDGDRVYTYGVEGLLVCTSIKDRKELWSLDTKEKYRFRQNFFGVGSVPLIVGDTLVVAVGGQDKGPQPDFLQAKSNGTGIVGLDKLTGKVKYTFSEELSSYSSPILANINGQKLGLYFGRSGLLGFDPTAGKEVFHFKWRAKIEESVNAANPVVIGDKVFISECYQKGSALLRIQDNKPTPIWTDDKKDLDEKALLAHWCTPIHDNGYLYACSGRNANDSDLRCINLLTGEVVWKETRTTRCTLLKVDGHILSLGEQGELRLFKLNPQKYEEVSRMEVPELSYPSWAPPVLSRGLLYLRGKDDSRKLGHKLVCYDFRK
jgi:outer membrane protein assembly factor BamB